MSSISPAINIGIGQYGTLCMSDLAKNFCLRESRFTKYVTFHQLDLVDGKLTMHNYDIESKSFQAFEVKNDEPGKLNLESWELHNFISHTYNNLITLTKELTHEFNFNAIHINLIFAAYEIEHLQLVKETILLIDKLKKQGDFGEVRVKCFSILSGGQKVSTPEQECSIAKTLDALVEIRENYNVLSHTFILDDKNTQAVSLKVKTCSLAFAISEIIVALIRNQYEILQNLPNNSIGMFSIGFGMVYFDVHYFTAFFNNRILASKIEIEKIDGRKTKVSTSDYTNAVQSSLLPYLEGTIDVGSMISNLNKIIKPEHFEHTLRCYEFLLANLLGTHNRIQLVEPIEMEDLYSIDDLIYWNLQNYVLTNEQKNDEGLLELNSYKKRLAEYNAKIADGVGFNQLDEEKEILEKHKNSVDDKIKHYNIKTRRKNIVLRVSSQAISEQLLEAKNNEKKLKSEFESKNIISKFFVKNKFNLEISNIEQNIQALDEELKKSEKRGIKCKSDLEQLYSFKNELSNYLSILSVRIDQITALKRKYQEKVDQLDYLDYEFLHNIISPSKLDAYEIEHRDDLQADIKEILRIIFIETNNNSKSITNLLDDKIKKRTAAIIDFNMSSHLLGEYKNMNLLDAFDFVAGLEKLKKRSFPFFNTIPTYTHQSHYLKYFDDSDRQKTQQIEDLLEENYTGSTPSYIHSESPHKFALFTVEVIHDLKSIVKYNNHFVRDN